VKIDPSWRVLTIGDGDLSFSHAISANYRPKVLCATVFDQISDVEEKYGLASYQQLIDAKAQVLSGFDVTDSQSWQGLQRQSFDLVIFQFPLIPNDRSAVSHQQAAQLGDANLRHRRLLRQFLLNAQQHFLAPQGQRLAIITSKDVKPYRQWDIEQSLTLDTSMEYLGQMPFDAQLFPGYQIRNVDRDKFVKQTHGISYFYSDQGQHDVVSTLTKADYLQGKEQFCGMCRVGPMLTIADRAAHQHSKRHHQMAAFDARWRKFLGLNTSA